MRKVAYGACYTHLVATKVRPLLIILVSKQYLMGFLDCKLCRNYRIQYTLLQLWEISAKLNFLLKIAELKYVLSEHCSVTTSLCLITEGFDLADLLNSYPLNIILLLRSF